MSFFFFHTLNLIKGNKMIQDPENKIPMFVHIEDNSDGTCTISMCMDGTNVMSSLLAISLLDFSQMLLGANGEFAEHTGIVTQELIDSGKVIEIPSDIGA